MELRISQSQQQPVRRELEVLADPINRDMSETAHNSKKPAPDSGFGCGPPTEIFPRHTYSISSGSEIDDEMSGQDFVAHTLQECSEVVLIESDRSSDTDDSRVEKSTYRI